MKLKKITVRMKIGVKIVHHVFSFFFRENLFVIGLKLFFGVVGMGMLGYF